MPFTRDPVSALFDAGARRLLSRAYARPGQWAGLPAWPTPRPRTVPTWHPWGSTRPGPTTRAAPGR